jgi:ribosome-associated toxin RatA of RatAB toxin-antitoxin module
MYDAVLRVGLPGLSPALVSTSASTLVEERYISRVRKTSPITNIVSNNDNGIMPMIWTVEAKSIQSKLFDSLKSRWQLTLINNDLNIQHYNRVAIVDDTTMCDIPYSSSSCSVNFEVEIQVSNPFVSLMLDQVLKDVAKKQVDAFERRGLEIPFQTA